MIKPALLTLLRNLVTKMVFKINTARDHNLSVSIKLGFFVMDKQLYLIKSVEMILATVEAEKNLKNAVDK